MTDWIRTDHEAPPRGELVDTKIDDERGVRNENPLIWDSNLWWLPDRSMYCYYCPTHWRPLLSED